MNWLADLFGAAVYLQHSYCLSSDPVMIALFVASDMTIWLSYFVIGGALLLTRERVVAAGAGPRTLYGAFIFLCGLTHLMKTTVLFTGIYRLDILVNMATAAVSAATAIMTTREVIGRE